MFKARIAIPAFVAVTVAASTAFAATGPTLKVTPSTVHQGSNVTFSGSGWAKRVPVTLRLGKPGVKGSNKIATVTTNRRGRFSYTLPVKPTSPTGQYLILACRKNCAVKVTKRMTIVP
jgi:hypothetical protein